MRTAIDLEAPGRIEILRGDFDRIAAAGGEPPPDRHDVVLERWLAAGPERVERAIELGCGAGDLLPRLAARADHVLGVDLSPRMLERARARNAGLANVSLIEADFLRHPLPEASFDRVISVATFHHVRLARALATAAALVRPGGALLVIDLFRPVGVSGFLYNVRNVLLRLSVDRRRPAPTRAQRDAWRVHDAHDRYPVPAEIARAAATLPGSRWALHPLWRWTLEWTRPAA